MRNQKKNTPTRTRREALLAKRKKSIDGCGNELFQLIIHRLNMNYYHPPRIK